MAKWLPRMCEALSSISSTTNTINKPTTNQPTSSQNKEMKIKILLPRIHFYSQSLPYPTLLPNQPTFSKHLLCTRQHVTAVLKGLQGYPLIEKIKWRPRKMVASNMINLVPDACSRKASQILYGRNDLSEQFCEHKSSDETRTLNTEKNQRTVTPQRREQEEMQLT